MTILAATAAYASLVPVGPVPFSGTGLGSVNTVLTVGGRPVESGCVARGPAGDVVGPTACPAGFAGGDERTGASQTLTRTIAELGLTTADDLRIVLNVNESTGNSVTLDNLALRIYDPAGAILFTSGAFIAPTFPLTHSPGTTVGYVFEFDATQAAQAQLVFAGTNRVGLATTLSGATAGNETFFVADVTAIGTPLFGADLAITKAATPSVIAGLNATYTLNVVNNGPEAATNAVVSDALPPQMTFVSVTAPAGWSCTTPAIGANGTVSCTKPTVAIGETASITIVARSCPETPCGTTSTNTATVTSATIDPVTANGTSSANTLIQAQADVGITKGASAAAVNPGGTIIYTLTVGNAGPSNSIGTSVVDTLPAGFTAVAIASTTGSCSGVGTASVNCNLGTLGAAGQCATAFPTGASITITALAGAALAPGIYTNTATVSTANCLADPDLTDNTATVPTTVPAGPVGADVAIVKVAPPTVIAGTNVTYTLTVTNSGPTTATNVVVPDPLPAAARFVSHSAPAGWICTTPAAGAAGSITCTKAAMAVAETAAFTTVARVCAETVCGTNMTNTGTVAAVEPDPIPANNSSTANVLVQAQSDVAVTKTSDTPFAVDGATVIYTITVTNAGPSNSVLTTLTDTLPPGFTATSVSSSVGTCTGTGTSTVNCNLGTLGVAGQCTTALPTSAIVTIAAQVPAMTTGTLVNTAIVATGNCLADPNLANNTATAPLTVPAAGVGGAPTLSEWGVIIFAVLLLLTGFYFMRS